MGQAYQYVIIIFALVSICDFVLINAGYPRAKSTR